MRVVFVMSYCVASNMQQWRNSNNLVLQFTAVFTELEGVREALFLQACCDKSHKDKGYIYIYEYT